MFNKAEQSNTSGDFGSESLASLQNHLYLYSIVVLGLLAVVTNSLVILIICIVTNIRRATSSIFFVNLCVIEIVASLSVLVAIFAVICDLETTEIHNWRTLFGGIQEFSKTVSILTIVQISFEKYMYIVHPMRHEACMTVGRSLASLCVTWVIGLLVCSLPEFCGGKYAMPDYVLPIRISWNTAIINKFIYILYFLVMFVLPTIIISLISLKLYKVAKRAIVAIEPAPNPLLPSCPSAKNSRKYSAVFVVEISDTQDKLRLSTSQCVRPTTVHSIRNDHCEQDSNKNNLRSDEETQTKKTSMTFTNTGVTRAVQRAGSQERRQISRRAFLFLTLPVLYFIVVWLPISVHQIVMSQGQFNIQGISFSEMISFVILQISYVINPVFYSFMSKAFRQEAFYAIKTCCKKDDNLVRPFSVEGSNEDFLQFLHRTSDSAQGEKDDDKKLSCNECDEIFVLNSFPENSIS